MKFRMVMIAALAGLGGCTGVLSESPLEADTVAEARCRAIRQHIPLAQRDTATDPTRNDQAICGRSRSYAASNGLPKDSSFNGFQFLIDASRMD